MEKNQIRQPAEKRQKSDLVEAGKFILLAVFLFAATILMYKAFVFVAKRNSKACSAIGRIWLTGDPLDASARKGCFTYEEIYQ